MQVPKPKVRKKILDSAIDEFLVVGYRRASMRNIAQQAGITVGNIYAYFSGKADLYETIVAPVMESINSLIQIEASEGTPSLETIADTVTAVFLENKKQFLILMHNSAPKYTNVRGQLIDLIRERLIIDLLPKLPPRAQDPLLAEGLAVAILEGLLNIFHRYGGDEPRLRILVDEFLKIIFNDIDTRFK
ncbi:MAG: TetR/AcrR family transcriptional regulator [Bacillota bacterium]|jgi:AcrR family transcriptional regulator|nr:TetR/AcrR family transcriptional regulator [Bacillota bacterium]HPZ21957.1 TetR/AcrR family transcriptional regulator [Bacillota bacterium]HQD19690.1 TetR/AcrR family transcriptional regulator [Bacillota bacterium]